MTIATVLQDHHFELDQKGKGVAESRKNLAVATWINEP
jgi:hypothetical protein